MKKFVKISLFITIMFMSLFITSKVKAATATITADNKEVEVGGKVTLSININAASWSLTASGDGIATKKYADVTSDGAVGNKTETITLDTSVVGTKTIKLIGTVSEPSGEGTKKTDVNTSVTVTVKEKAQTNNPTNNAGGNTGNSNTSGGNTSSGTQTPTPEPEKVKLTSLKINSTTYIKQLKTNLSVTVEGQEEISILPKTSDGSSCKITNSTNKETKTVKSGSTGKIKLNEGTNKITVTGSFDETYTITVINKKKEEETPPNVMEEPTEEPVEETKIILKSLSVKGVKIVTEEENEVEEKVDFVLTPEFSSEVYEYTINIPKEQNDITKLDIEAIGDKEDYTVEITGNENLVDGENIITILVKSKDGEKTAEYKIKVNKETEEVAAVTTPVLDETQDTGTDDSKTIIKVAIVGGIALIAAIAIIVVLIKYRNSREDEEETFDNNQLEYEKENVLEDLLKNKDSKKEEQVSKFDFEENIDVEPKKEINSYEESYDDEKENKSKGIDFASILKNKITEKNEISSKRRAKSEDVEETFEVLKEEDTSTRKRGKHF